MVYGVLGRRLGTVYVGDCECRIDIVSIAEYERPSVRITVLNGVVEVISSSDLRSGPWRLTL